MKATLLRNGRLTTFLAVAMLYLSAWALTTGFASVSRHRDIEPDALPSANPIKLADPELSPPITIVPQSAQTTLTPVADARVRNSSASSNYGTDDELRARAASSGSNYESYLRFNLSSVGPNIASARLRLYGALDESGTSVATAIFAVTNTSWSETGINWNNKPGSETSPLATATVLNTTNRYYEWDITSFVQTEKNAGRELISLAAKATNSSSPYVAFNSR
jgi:hypothetical protein